MIVIFFGPPGSGKGTQAAFLEKNNNFVHVSTGNLLREEIQNKTPLGLKIQKIVEKGEFPSNEILYSLIHDQLKKKNKLFLFDGFPRNEEQALYFETYLKNNNLCINKAVFFDMDHTSLIKRLTGREMCPSCSTLYNIFFKPTKQENICDVCGVEGLVRRKDDTIEFVQKRIEIYNEKTKPLKKFYTERGLMASVNANKSSQEVYSEIKNMLEIKKITL